MVLGGPSFSISSSSAVVAATQWVQAVLLGDAATAIAVISIAWLGVLLLQGRLPVARGARAVLGCFIVFGSATIAAGLVNLAQSKREAVQTIIVPPPSQAPLPAPAPATNADPYAGASVPM